MTYENAVVAAIGDIVVGIDFTGLIVGSVSQQVPRDAHCAVLIAH